MRSLFVAGSIVICCSAFNAFAQAANSVSAALESSKALSQEIKNRSIALEQIRREAGEERARPVQEKAKFPEIKQDFERIQILNANYLQIPLAALSPDYKTIHKAITEIKKRAGRLRANLFPMPDGDSPATAITKKERGELLQKEINILAKDFDKTLADFTANGIFKNIQLVNLNDSEKAENDLDKIIFLCAILENKIKIAEDQP